MALGLTLDSMVPRRSRGPWHSTSSFPTSGARMRSHNRLQHKFLSHVTGLNLINMRVNLWNASMSGMVNKLLLTRLRTRKLDFTGRTFGSLNIPLFRKWITSMFTDIPSNQEFGISRTRLLSSSLRYLSSGNLMELTRGSVDISAWTISRDTILGGRGRTFKSNSGTPAKANEVKCLNFIKSMLNKTLLLTIPWLKFMVLMFAAQGPKYTGADSMAQNSHFITDNLGLLSNVPLPIIDSGLNEISMTINLV